MKRILLMNSVFVCLLFCQAWAQDRVVTGKVTSVEDGATLPGVNVQIKGTQMGTTTAADGSYRINATNDATLVFSFIGLVSQEVVIGNRTVVDLAMRSDVKQLGEVVVTALGIQREKKALGYAVSNVSGDALQQRSEPDPLRALTAKVPGVSIIGGGGAPGQATKINIRGNSSLTGSTQPLFIVDGIPFDNSVNGGDASDFAGNTATSNRAYDIDPNNIESMTVLKGAAAAALYGSRATNGVIVITTKSGGKNRKKGMEVTYNLSYAQERLASKPDYQNKYTQGSNQNYNGGFIGNWGAPFPEYVDEINAQYGTNYTKTYSRYRFGPNKGEPYPDGFIEIPLAPRPNFCVLYPELCDEYGNGQAIKLQPHDNIGEFFKTGHLLENSINISSTGDKTSLNAGVSRMTNEGIVENLKATRTSLNFGGNAMLANRLTLSGNVNFVNTTQTSPPVGAGYYTDYGGYGNEGSIYGRLYYLPRNFDLNGYPFENPITGDNLFYRSGLDNPRWSTKYNTYNSVVNRVFGNMAMSYDVTSWLNLLVKGGINTYSENRKTITRKGGTSIPLGRIRNQDLTNTEQDYNLIATITKDIGENFSFRGIVGANANERSYNSRVVIGTDIIQTGLNNTSATATQIVPQDITRLRRLYGVYTDLQFAYKNIYFLGFVARNDWASTLPTNNRSYFYPGVNAAVAFTEALKISSSVLSFGKIRAAYTKVGREADPYQVETVYRLSSAYRNAAGGTFFNASLDNELKNANLKPEFTTEFEVGTELQFFQNRIGIDFSYFDRQSKDLIVSQRVAASSGFTEKVVNAGQINNNGIELQLNITPVRTDGGFEWVSSFAFTRLRSKVIDAGPQGEIFLGGTGLSSLGTIHRTGEPYGMIFGTKNARDAQGNLLINENTGLPFTLPSSQIIGNPAPDFTLGWSNTVSWKGFTLSALLDYRQGGKMWSSTAASLLLRGQLKNSEDREALRVVPGVYGDPATYEPILDGEGQPMRNTTGITAFDYHFSDGFGAYGADEVSVYDITTIRLREVTLGYSLPKSLLSRTPFGAARISFSGRNLWFYTPNMLEGLNFDPEVLSTFPDSNIQGFDLGATPSTRRYGVNLSISF
jgi:TonB-linked SusC/RagA family outer membrane protein